MPLRRSRRRPRAERTLIACVLLALGTPLAAQNQWGAGLNSRASMARTKGAEEAPIFVYEFANFQCTHCAKFALEVFPRIDSAFVQTGRVRWIFVHLPAPTDANAWAAHEAAACAGAVGDRFWAMHDLLFAFQKSWQDEEYPRAVFDDFARDLNIAPEAFDRCLLDDQVATVLLQDVIFAASTRIDGTPAFLVNNQQMVMGLKSFKDWTDILEKALKKAR